MSANINSMFYTGATPWHGLGTKVDGALTASEAIVKAGLNWEVEKRPLFAIGADGKPISVPGRFAVVRSDTQKSLGVVGKRFSPLQNKDAFSVADAIVGLKEAHYETAGALGLGEKIWLLVRLDGTISAGGDDTINKYLLFANGHGGQMSVTTAITGIRVVCENTLRLGLAEAQGISRVRHTGNIGLKVDSIRESIGLVHATFGALEKKAQLLAGTQVSSAQVKSYLQALDLKAPGRDPLNDSEKAKFARLDEIGNYIEALFDGGAKGSELRSSRGTAWGAYNAVTEFVDHHKAPRVKTGKDDARADSILFGAGAELKDRALETALTLV